MIRPEDYDEKNEQEKLDEAQGGNDSFEEDSDYFSFKRLQDRALESEYGSELSKGDRMDDSGNYKFETGDDLNLEEIHRKREKIYTYHYFKGVLNGMEPDEVSSHLEDLEKAGIMSNIHRRRGVGGVFLGLDFRKDGAKTYYRVINRKIDPKTKRLTGGFAYSDSKVGKNIEVLQLFKRRLMEARRMYEERPSGVIDEEVRSVMSDGDDTGTVQENPDDNQNQGVGDVVRFNKDREEVSFERQQENRELASVIEEEVEQTKFELIEEVELDMQGHIGTILWVFLESCRGTIILNLTTEQIIWIMWKMS